MSTLESMNKLVRDHNRNTYDDRLILQKTASILMEIECLKVQLARIIKNIKID